MKHGIRCYDFSYTCDGNVLIMNTFVVNPKFSFLLIWAGLGWTTVADSTAYLQMFP